jgi:hypothetical protein
VAEGEVVVQRNPTLIFGCCACAASGQAAAAPPTSLMTSVHPITSSASDRRLSEILTPRALAVLRFDHADLPVMQADRNNPSRVRRPICVKFSKSAAFSNAKRSPKLSLRVARGWTCSALFVSSTQKPTCDFLPQ